MVCLVVWSVFFFQAEDGIRDLVRSRGLGDVYKRQVLTVSEFSKRGIVNDLKVPEEKVHVTPEGVDLEAVSYTHLTLPTIYSV